MKVIKHEEGSTPLWEMSTGPGQGHDDHSYDYENAPAMEQSRPFLDTSRLWGKEEDEGASAGPGKLYVISPLTYLIGYASMIVVMGIACGILTRTYQGALQYTAIVAVIMVRP